MSTAAKLIVNSKITNIAIIRMVLLYGYVIRIGKFTPLVF